MGDSQFALGLDYGTNSVRALIVDVADGREVGAAVWEYATGDHGVWLEPGNPHLARQHPQDWMDGFFEAVKGALAQASADPAFAPDRLVGIGVDTTGSTPLPVDSEAIPLALHDEFKDNLHALAWLWKDHTAHGEAEEITRLAESRGEPYLSKCGGAYSSEWFWSKLLRCLRGAPYVFAASHTWVEAQDWIPAWLCGVRSAASIPRGVCAAGHKAMYHPDWGGLPSREFLGELDPRLSELRLRLYERAVPAGTRAGELDPELAARVGLPQGLPVSVGAFDAHLGAVGSGVSPGTLVKIMGTSTCDIMVGDEQTPDIPGVCGIVPGSVIPGMLGIEAGQSAVGDLFNWCAQRLGDGRHEPLAAEAATLAPGQSGLLALDWNNGNRTVLVDPLLTGLLVGQTLHTTVGEIYRALIEATAFGARTIIERIREYAVAIDEVVVCGGIAEKSPLTMQIYADVCGMPIKISRSTQTCALGAAISGAVAGGAHPDFLLAIHAMTGVRDEVYEPSEEASEVYGRLYGLYRSLHDAFGGVKAADLSGLMRELGAIRREVHA